MSDPWAALDAELSQWSDGAGAAPVWWRDDDAADAGPALDRLLELAAEFELPLGLAAIPADATEALSRRLQGEPSGIAVLQHGYAHQNHAPAGERKIELGLHRPVMLIAGELGTGWLALERLFGTRACAVLVPPWNRIHPSLIPILPEIGLRGLSTLGPRTRRQPVHGLVQVNVHVDVVDWRDGRRFVGTQEAIGRLVAELQERRRSGSPDIEPIGVMTHHLVMDEEAWGFVRDLWHRLKNARTVSILHPGTVFLGTAPGRSLSQSICE